MNSASNDLSDFRVHSGGFVVMPNEAVNDNRLSFRARGVLAYLLGRPPGWRFSAERICKEGKEGREAIATALRELTAAGYYRCTRVRGDGPGFAMITEVAASPTYMPTVAPEATRGSGFLGSTFLGATNPPPLVSKETQEREPTTTPPPSVAPPATERGDLCMIETIAPKPAKRQRTKTPHDIAAQDFMSQWWLTIPKASTAQSYVAIRNVVRIAMENEVPADAISAALSSLIRAGRGITSVTLTNEISGVYSRGRRPSNIYQGDTSDPIHAQRAAAFEGTSR